MSAPRALFGNALSSTISAALPVLSRVPSDRLLGLVPAGMRERAGRNLAAVNFLKHLSARDDDAALTRARVQSYVVNPVVASRRNRMLAGARHGTGGVGALIITPHVECNLDCQLCYNKDHDDPEACLSPETMSRVVREGKALGAFRVSIIGGEPLLRWREILGLVEAHPDVLFTIMTNGTLLTGEMAASFARLSNVELSFSIDGFEETNDAMRGAGTYSKVIAAMARYRDAGGMLLYSPTVTSENYREVLSGDFIDLMLEQGAYMGYHHHYYLVGGQDRVELLLDRDQLRWIGRRAQEVMAAKPIMIFDNVLTGLFDGGCQAIKEYVHINHMGGVEPCCMVQFARDSVHDKSLVDALRSEFFSTLCDVPHDATGVKRCLVGGNCQAFKELVDQGDARPQAPHATDVFAHIDSDRQERLPTCFSVR